MRHTPLNVPHMHEHTDRLLLLFLQVLGVCWVGGAEFLQPSSSHAAPAVPLVYCCLDDFFCYLEINFFFPESFFIELAKIVVINEDKTTHSLDFQSFKHLQLQRESVCTLSDVTFKAA